jgi:hypothetical protein
MPAVAVVVLVPVAVFSRPVELAVVATAGCNSQVEPMVQTVWVQVVVVAAAMHRQG